ncbi:glycoside hydrolase family 3 N-terminal domain-containing protein [Streptomyces sp. L7]
MSRASRPHRPDDAGREPVFSSTAAPIRRRSARPDTSRGCSCLGIPELRLTDGPAGVRVNEHASAMPAPVALASSFDDGLAREFGRAVGRDGRALGQDVLLAPMTNTIRVPYAGRNFETFSEDPLLNSRMVAGEVEGVQSQGLIATVKHYAENNQEDNRMGVNVNVDEQTLRQIELPAFEAAVTAGAGAVMCSYNSVNAAATAAAATNCSTRSSRSSGAFRAGSCRTGARPTRRPTS